MTGFRFRKLVQLIPMTTQLRDMGELVDMIVDTAETNGTVDECRMVLREAERLLAARHPQGKCVDELGFFDEGGIE